MQVKRQDPAYDRGWTPRPHPPPLNHMGSFGHKPYYPTNMRPWPGQTGQRHEPMMNDYVYPAPRQHSGRRRPAGRGGLANQPGDFYSSSYDDASQNAYADYIQPYEYDDVRRVPWPSGHQLPYDDSDEAGDFSDDKTRSRFSSAMTTASVDSGDYQCCFTISVTLTAIS